MKILGFIGALALACVVSFLGQPAFAGAATQPFFDPKPDGVSLMALPAVAVAVAVGAVVLASLPPLGRMLAVALVAGAVVAGCQTTAIDNRIAEVSDRLAARCADLKAAVLVIDLFAPDRQRAAVKQGEAVLDRFCAKPPRTAAELTIALGEVLHAQQAIDAAKRG